MAGSSTIYSRLFLFVAALAIVSGLAHALNINVSVNLTSPADNYLADTSNNSVTMSYIFGGVMPFSTCTLYVNNSSSITQNIFSNTTLSVGNMSTGNTTSTTSFVQGNYTWYTNCYNATGDQINALSSTRMFILDNSAPSIFSSNFTNPDFFYSPNDKNLSIGVVLNGTGSGISWVTGTLYNQSNYSMATFTFQNSNNTSTYERWNGSMDVSHMINGTNSLRANGTLNSGNPVAGGFWVNITYKDKANNSGQAGTYTTVNPTGTGLLLHDLGSFAGPPSGFNTCFQEGDLSTNMSNITNFYAVNLTKYARINGSAECSAQFGGPSQAAPWGSAFRTVGYISFASVDISNQTKAGQVMGAMGNLIRMQIAPPHSFASSRIFVNSSGLDALNTSATIALFDLPFTSSPNMVSDNGSSINITWEQGGFDTIFNATVGNLTLYVTHFSGYNATDNTTPFANITLPTISYYINHTNDSTVMINFNANDTGTGISKVVLNVSKGLINYTYIYNNVTGAYNNNANCTNSTALNDNFTCSVTTPALADGIWTVNVTVYDYGGASPGNSNSTKYTFTVDTTGPVVTLNFPKQGANITGVANTTIFRFTAYDALSSNLSCNISIENTGGIIGGGPANRTLWVVNNTLTESSINYSTAAAGNPNSNLTNVTIIWSVNCSDNISNVGQTGNASFYMGTSTSGSPSSILGSGFANLGVTIAGAAMDGSTNYTGNSTVNLTSGGGVVLSFGHNFTYILNFQNINITNGTGVGLSSTDAVWYVIRGVNTTNGMSTKKTAYMYGVPSSYGSVCVNDVENATIGGMTSTCTGASEVSVLCDGIAGASGITCTKSTAGSLANLTISGLSNSVIAQFSASSTSSGSSSGSGSGGGGSTGAGGGGAPTPGTANDYSVDVGAGRTCTVTVSREIAPTTQQSIVTTTLENTGGAGCALTDFVFADTIPDSFSAINEIAFSPQYSSREGWTVSFGFPSFASGESKTLTYTVNKWVPPSKLNDFTAVSLSAKKSEAAGAPTPTPTETPGTTGQPSATGTQPPAGSAQKPAPSPAAAPAPSAGGLGGLLSGATLLVILVAVAIVIGAVYFLVVKSKRKGL